MHIRLLPFLIFCLACSCGPALLAGSRTLGVTSSLTLNQELIDRIAQSTAAHLAAGYNPGNTQLCLKTRANDDLNETLAENLRKKGFAVQSEPECKPLLYLLDSLSSNKSEEPFPYRLTLSYDQRHSSALITKNVIIWTKEERR